ncbi:MAG: response regulator [Clostridiaceae bacterium]
MLKVVIADDEDRICRLIVKLIDWDALEMNVVGIAHNGIEAIELIKTLLPDIVITDIRMPGYDGLDMIMKAKEINEAIEFIIISGYGQFEYAQKALRYGVSDYLLKPIKKEELEKTLQKIKETLKDKRGMLSLEEKHDLQIRNEQEEKRYAFLSNLLLLDEEQEEDFELEKVNQEHFFFFKPGALQFLNLKVDCDMRLLNNNRKPLEEKVGEILELAFKDLVYEISYLFEDSSFIILLNYDGKQSQALTKKYGDLIKELQTTRPISNDMAFTLGVGAVVNSIGKLGLSYETSRWAVEERILKGSFHVLEIGERKETDLISSEIINDFYLKFSQKVERLDIQGTAKVLEELKENILRLKNVSGHEIIHITKEICNLYTFTLRKSKFRIMDGITFLNEFENKCNSCKNLDMVFHTLQKSIATSMQDIMEEKTIMDSKPIRDAKRYMESNYMKNLTLDEVSGIIGFSASYFSSMFKKETGVSFIEYISDVRISRAKELLKESDLRVSDVCEMVGYSDVKYFTKSFIKHTGLKPNEFRKIYR